MKSMINLSNKNIPEGWSLEVLEKQAIIVMGQSPESKFYNNNKGVPFLQGIRTFGDKYPFYDTYTNKVTKLAKKGSVLLSVRAPVGEVNIADRDVCIGRGLMSINSNNNTFLYYLLKAYKSCICEKETGTVYGSVTRTDIAELELPFPPKEEQEKIAEILSSLDDKIELNRKINKNLEEIASTIFKKWFIDTGDELPEGWKNENLSSFGEVVCGKTPLKSVSEYFGGNVPFIKIPDMHGNIFIIKTEDSLTNSGVYSQKSKTIPKDSICVSCIATVGLVSITTRDSQTNQQINSIIPSNKFYQFYLFHTLRNLRDYLQRMGSSGSTTLNINTRSFSSINIIKPDDETLKKFDNLIRPIYEYIKINAEESLALSLTREALLPRLMNGRIRVI